MCPRGLAVLGDATSGFTRCAADVGVIVKRLPDDNRPVCVDIYCGAGGTTFGAQQAGLRVAYGLDIDKSAIETFAANHPEAYADCRDVSTVSAAEILDLAGIDQID